MGASSHLLDGLSLDAEAEGAQMAPRHGFRHEVILHGDGADGFIRQTMPLIERALDENAPVLIAVSRDRIMRLREALGARRSRVGLIDIRELGANPARIIPAWRKFLEATHRSDVEPLGIGEPVWAGRAAPELDECWRHEALLNLAFGTGRPWRLLCTYDLDGLDDHVIEAAHICHPLIAHPDGAHPSSSYRSDPRPFDGTLAEPPAEACELGFGEADLGEIRRRVASWAGAEGLSTERTSDLVLAVDEIGTNSIRHGGGRGRLRMWRQDGALLCEIRDEGQMKDPLLGRVRPNDAAVCGRGMWIVNQLCDLVQVRSSAAGSQIRLHKRLD